MAFGTSTKLTYEDYLHLPEDGRRHEIIDGEHCVSPGPNTKHQIVSVNLIRALDGFVRARRLGRVFHAPYDVVLSEVDVVQPDVLFLSNARAHRMTEANLRAAPGLVVEILSDTHRRHDEIVKKKLYERHDVLEYWIADPELDSLKIYRRSGDAFAPAEILSTETGGAVTTPLLPGFSVDIDEVFAQ